MEDYKVSVIIPVYNGEAYVSNCLSGLKNQKYSNIELIVVNDGSTDNTQDSVLAFINEHSEMDIKFINQDNKGVSVARNRAIDKATGKFIAFIDVDDEIDCFFICKMVEAFKNNNCKIVVCGYNTKVKNSNDYTDHSKFLNEYTNTNEIMIRSLRYRDILSTVWNKMFLTSVIKSNHLKFREDIFIGEDMLFLIEYCICVDNAAIINDRLYTYLLNPMGAMQAHKNHASGFKSSWLTEWYAIKEVELLLSGRNELAAKSVVIKKVRIADKLLSNIKQYNYKDNQLEKELLLCLRYHVTSIRMHEFSNKKKASILLNAISPSLCHYVKKNYMKIIQRRID